MKKILAVIAILAVALPLYSQKKGRRAKKEKPPEIVADVAYINTVADKPVATVGDGMKLYVLSLGIDGGDFKANMNLLLKAGILKHTDYIETAPLRRGTLARMIARHLKLNDSFFFNLFGTERYAFRACIAEEIMDYDGSEWDKLSGGELLEILRRVSEKTGGGND